ncbi:MAG: PorP/SprF family type IX secretion system membrane protein [Bacteroidales bacterium]|nr:PorP/SprF family type IX secretion system membrane protein [Bacteroidales bacterium]
MFFDHSTSNIRLRRLHRHFDFFIRLSSFTHFFAKRYIYLVIFVNILIFSSSNCFAQDTHLSMYYMAPLILNPANTGNFNEQWRVAGNYRNQWSALGTSFQTATVSYDRKFYVLEREFSGGLMAVYDNTGVNGINFNKFYASAGYGFQYKKHFINAGVQAGYVNGSTNNLIFDSYWDETTGEYNTSDASSESISYLDVNVGFSWKKNFNIFTPEAGISLMHVNYPKPKFTTLGSTEAYSMRPAFYVSVLTSLSDVYYVKPAIYHSTTHWASTSLIGSNGGKKVRGNSMVKEIFAGIYMRYGFLNNIDAVLLQAGTSLKKVDIAINYDLNVSSLREVSGYRGAFEIAFIYRRKAPPLNTYSIPCNRL